MTLLIKVRKHNCLSVKLINKSAVDVTLFKLILSFSRTELYSVAIWPFDAPVLLTSSCFLSFFKKKKSQMSQLCLLWQFDFLKEYFFKTRFFGQFSPKPTVLPHCYRKCTIIPEVKTPKGSLIQIILDAIFLTEFQAYVILKTKGP